MVTTSAEATILSGARRALGAEPIEPAQLTICGPEAVLPSVFDVTALAAASVALANVAAAELLAARTGDAVRPVTVDRLQASAAFLSEALFAPDGWERPAPWDPVAGDYPTADGWIRLHTNYRNHRLAALAALGVADDPALDRTALASIVAERGGDSLETAVVAAGGCAAVMRTADEWRAHPAGTTLAGAEILDVADVGEGRPLASGGWVLDQPLAGIKVLDLTRVIAGPVCTRFLATHGAEVLRLDPPGFEEVGALVPITTAGKRCAALDLASVNGAARFAELLAEADVLVCGLRGDALDRLGFSTERLHAMNPALVVARLDAYGWDGPWAARRGFDSLVQMSTGIAAEGQRVAGSTTPRPLPAQALDHGSGYLLAAGVCHALGERARRNRVVHVRAALAVTAGWLTRLPTPDGLATPMPDLAPHASEHVDTAWGPASAVPVPGTIDACPQVTLRPAGPLGRDAPTFA